MAFGPRVQGLGFIGSFRFDVQIGFKQGFGVWVLGLACRGFRPTPSTLNPIKKKNEALKGLGFWPTPSNPKPPKALNP